MTDCYRPSRLVKAGFGVALAATLLGGLWAGAAAVGAAPNRPDITDFHAVHLVGRLIAEGHMADAYRTPAMLRLEQGLGGRPVFMPWSYPPAYGLVAAPLHALGLIPGFLVFSLASLALYLAAMRRLGGEACWPVLLACFVAMALNLRCGQNGLLTGGLTALVAICALHRRPLWGGTALALLSLKPHLVLILPMWLALRRRWLNLAVAAAGTLALTLLSFAVLGREVFAAFLASMPDVGRMMAAGAYPLHRMTSLYAFALSLGLPPWLALLIHVGAATVVLAMIGRRVLRGGDPRVELGLVVMTGLFVSPYVYDYDQTVLGVALVLLAPALMTRLSRPRYLLLLGGCGLAQSLGLLVNTVTAGAPDGAVSLAGPVLMAMALMILHVLRVEAPAGVRTRTEEATA
ncbi:MAG TPA: glycosyltransferase family 87 protein [Lichenihabitans sp.]|jgi:hypothetical protein|nr:glycosyltransferase family 87 protein [Lichenihabitans sp.]